MRAGGRVLLASQTYDRLRQEIIRGEIKPGERLTEARLAELLKVSRTPIREALGRLEMEGLLVRDGAGLAVMPLDFAAASEVLLIRQLLEPYCAETSAPLLTVAETSRLQSLVMEMRAILESKEDEASLALADLNISYHDLLYSHCPYPRLLEELRRSRDHFVTYWLFGLYGPADLERSMREHGEIADLAARVAAGTAEASLLGSRLRDHIGAARGVFEEKSAEELATSTA